MTEMPDLLGRLAARCETHGWALGAIFSRYCEVEQRTRETLAKDLGCSEETLRWMSVCRRPRADHFADDVKAVAERFKVSASQLASIVRRVEAIEALQRPGSPQNDEQMLLAARDRGDE